MPAEARTRTRTCTRTRTRTRKRTHTHTHYTRARSRTHACMHHARMHARMHACMHVCVCARTLALLGPLLDCVAPGSWSIAHFCRPLRTEKALAATTGARAGPGHPRMGPRARAARAARGRKHQHRGVTGSHCHPRPHSPASRAPPRPPPPALAPSCLSSSSSAAASFCCSSFFSFSFFCSSSFSFSFFCSSFSSYSSSPDPSTAWRTEAPPPPRRPPKSSCRARAPLRYHTAAVPLTCTQSLRRSPPPPSSWKPCAGSCQLALSWDTPRRSSGRPREDVDNVRSARMKPSGTTSNNPGPIVKWKSDPFAMMPTKASTWSLESC